MNSFSPAEMVLVLDFGGQYNQLIARRVRENGVYCEMLPFNTSLDEIMKRQPRGIIFTGGPASVYVPGAARIDAAIYHTGIPILGICYGMQLMARDLGGEVVAAQDREYGRATLKILKEDPLFAGLPVESQCWMSHGDRVEAPPVGFAATASTDYAPVAAFSSIERKLYGVQFHPEVNHTRYGQDILSHFLRDVCGCHGDWNMRSFIEREIEAIQARVGEEQVVCALSGGVDSSVAALLIHQAIGEQLTCIFVDTGMLRLGEAEQVRETFASEFRIPLIFVDAGERFLRRLQGVIDPEAKRKIIGEEFIRIFEEQAEQLGDVQWLVQGTLYPDVVESGTTTAATIKSHHNVGGLPSNMRLRLLEPLRMLFKDEVREVGKELGLADAIVWRQPFPGPGLAIRILGDVTRGKLEILRHADAIVLEEIRNAGLYKELWQSFAVLPSNMKSVGVMGDERTYAYPIVLRAVTSDDAMTADWARLPYDVLDRIASRLVNEVPEVNRVVYDITSKPPGTIEWE